MGRHLHSFQHREGVIPAKREHNAGSNLCRGVWPGSAKELRPGWPGSGVARCKRPSNAWTSPLPPRRAAGALGGGQAGALQQRSSQTGEGFPRIRSQHVLYEPAHFVLEC